MHGIKRDLGESIDASHFIYRIGSMGTGTLTLRNVCISWHRLNQVCSPKKQNKTKQKRKQSKTKPEQTNKNLFSLNASMDYIQIRSN